MSDQPPPFVVRRPDGFVGVELQISDQLTVEESRLLAWQLLVAAHYAEIGGDFAPSDPPAWLIWERAADGGRPFLRAVDLSEQKAEAHVAYLKAEARMQRPPKPEPDLLIEETRLDHLYAAALMEAVRRRAAKRRGED